MNIAELYALAVSVLTPEFFAAAIRIATPIILASLSATICERAGVINIGIEGMMLAGAFAAASGSYVSQSPLIGAMAGITAGGLMGLILGFGTITLKANQVVLGAAINIFVAGLTGFLTTVIFGSPGVSARVPGFAPLRIPLLADVPWVGTILFSHTPIVYLAIILGVVGNVFLFHTPLGNWIRAAGDRPLALHGAGVNVNHVRYLSVFLSGCLAGLGGVHLSLEVTHHFSVNMTAGRGFIGLAANIFGKWTPLGSLGTSLLFGFADSLSLNASALRIAPELLLMMPFVLAIVVLVSVMGRATAPRALGKAYNEESE